VYFTPKRLKLYLWALIVLQVATCLNFRSPIRGGSIDFRSYYAAGYMVRTGDAAHLYNYSTEERVQDATVTPAPIALPFYAPPFVALLFAPLSYAPYVWALLLFGIVNLILLALAIRVMRPHLLALAARWPSTPPLLFLSFLPVGLTLVMGQLSILILLIDCLAFALLEGGEPFLAGLVFSLALMKFQTAVPVAILFLLWRRWRFTLGFLTGAAALGAVSAWILGAHRLLPYLHSVFRMSALAGTELQAAVGVAPRRMANLYGLLFSLTPTNHLATILTLLASILLLAWATTRPPSFPFALLLAILVSYHFYPCDLTLLLLPISLLFNQVLSGEAEGTSAPEISTSFQRNRSRVLACALGTFLIAPLMAEIISNDLIFLFALPILTLVLTSTSWPSLHGPSDAAPIPEPSSEFADPLIST
jgi:hypothetical protein